jgi:hypothetical protein
MARLGYSSNGMLRALEMSRANVTAFVEGFLDRSFFSHLVGSNTSAVGKVIEIRLAHELDSSLGNGKTALLALHAILKHRSRLAFMIGTARKAVIFFLDKDVDDIRRTRRRCEHVIYTEHYSVENYLFRNGDIAKAISCGACLDCQSVGAWPSNRAWTNQAARAWVEWIAFCLMTTWFRTPGLPNFGARSLIHGGEYKPLDAAKEATLLAAVSKRTGRTMAAVKAAYKRELKRVTKSLGDDTVDRFFNGKWYSGFLAKDAERVAAGRQLPQGLEERLEVALMTTLDFRGFWTDELQKRITPVLSRF